MPEKKTAKFFDKYSQDFSSLYGNRNKLLRIIDNIFRKSMVFRFRKTLEECMPVEGKSALDVGCGPGHYCIALAQLGIKKVKGIDFSPKMIELATELAAKNGFGQICSFEAIDFFNINELEKYDYLILMGFMDYIREPRKVIEKAMHLSRSKVLFSFPAARGPLAWQRKLRYIFKCPLYLYTERRIHTLFSGIAPWTYRLEKISRDYFVTMETDRPEQNLQ